MRILVTGGLGFIGSHVVDAYVESGHEVAVLDDLSRGSLANLNAHVKFYQGDICNQPLVEKVFAEFRPEVVNHHAAQMDVRRGVREPVFDATVNILGSVHLLEAAIRQKTSRFIYISSAGAVYGEPDHSPVPEGADIRPIAPYGISKHTVEHYLFTFFQLYGLKYVVLRYGNVYGPRQSSKGEAGVFAIFSEQMMAGVQPVIYGDGTKQRDYVYISDVVEANVAALDYGAGEIFNIASGVPTTDLQVFTTVRELVGKGDVEPQFDPHRPGEVQRIWLNIQKAQRLLSWAPRVSLDEGARLTVGYFRQSVNVLANAAN
jgi:UDP-glucose 4-epimerase